MVMTLTELLGGRDIKGDTPVLDITVDSRKVKPGCVFVALPGSKMDGRQFIAEAVAKGASAVLTSPDVDPAGYGVSIIHDVNPRRRYADLAARFYEDQPKMQIAVTGTNGKTSVAEFTRQLWAASGLDAASIGTLGVKSNKINIDGGLTTPDPMALHGNLKALSDAGVVRTALEASSHGLDQYRLDGVRLSAAGFTNLSRDHLDYHKTEQGYLFAKARLFGELLLPGQIAVINRDDRWGGMLEDLAWGRGIRTIPVGRCDKAVLRLLSQDVSAAGQDLKIAYEGQTYDAHLPLVGAFQADNVLVAAGLAMATGVAIENIVGALSGLAGVPGRMEKIGNTPAGGAVFVDYAHTPDGLKTVLTAAKAHNPSKLHVVFGCGGDRDAGKRPQMGEIAANLADHVYVTDDNPRSEDAAQIRSEILAACPDAIEIGDRRKAIEAAMNAMGAGDMLVIAGKGHEEGQLVGAEVLPFSDIGTVRELLGLGSGSDKGAVAS